MDRRSLIECIKYDAKHKWLKNRKQVRLLLEANDIEEVGGRLTYDEIRYIFGEVKWAKPLVERPERDIETLYLLVCETCGRYTKLRWYFKPQPNSEDIWKMLTMGTKLYSPKDNLLECYSEEHEIIVKPFSEYEDVKLKKWEIKSGFDMKEAEELLDSVLD